MVKRTRRLFQGCGFQSDAGSRERLGEKLGGGERDGGWLEEGSVEGRLQEIETGVVSFVAAFVDGPRRELGRISDFLQRQ